MSPAPQAGRQGGCVEFLQWALPKLGYQWTGFRRVHRQVCKRIGRRLRELHLGDLTDYCRHLEAEPSEWRVLDGFCWIPISRFGRDREIFECLGREVLPHLAQAAVTRGAASIEAWSVGCARGEEVYTLNAVWRFMVAPAWPQLSIAILGTDIDGEQLDRAQSGLFKGSSLAELPPSWREAMFARTDVEYRIRPAFCSNVRFQQQDIREVEPPTTFELILCRNLVLTYFEQDLQCQTLKRLVSHLRQDGAFVIGAREALPPIELGLVPWGTAQGIYRRVA